MGNVASFRHLLAKLILLARHLNADNSLSQQSVKAKFLQRLELKKIVTWTRKSAQSSRRGEDFVESRSMNLDALCLADLRLATNLLLIFASA